MRTAPLVTAALLLSALTHPAPAQTLARRIADAPDGTVTVRFAARPGVCGDGRTFIAEGIGGARWTRIYSQRGSTWTNRTPERLRERCVAGPLRVDMTLRDGRITGLRVFAGPDDPDARPTTDLGTVGAQAAAEFLLDWSQHADEDGAREAMLAAALARDARIAERLAAIARDHALTAPVRERAIRWMAEAAEREEYDGATGVLRDIAADRTDEVTVRERAIRGLDEAPAGDDVLRGLYPNLDRITLKERAIRVAGEFGGDANAAWLRGIARDASEAMALRERAIRTLGNDLYELASLRGLYGELDATSLKERIIRVMAEEHGAETEGWLQQIIEDGSERHALRERAIRVLGERGGVAYLRGIYPRVTETDLRERIMRTAAEHGTTADAAWLRDIAVDTGEPVAVRERAVRLLAASRMATADLADLYDEIDSRAVRDRLLRLLAERGDRTAVDKLNAVMENDPSRALRDRARRLLRDH